MKTKYLIQPVAVLFFLAQLPGNPKAMTTAAPEVLQMQSQPGPSRPESKSLIKSLFGKSYRMYCQEKTKIRPKGIQRVKGCYKFK